MPEGQENDISLDANIVHGVLHNLSGRTGHGNFSDIFSDIPSIAHVVHQYFKCIASYLDSARRILHSIFHILAPGLIYFDHVRIINASLRNPCHYSMILFYGIWSLNDPHCWNPD